MSDEALQEEAQEYITAIARVFNDPALIAEKASAWLRNKVPQRTAEAMWLTIEGDRDKGLEVRLFERPLPRWPTFKARLGALIGTKTAGLDISVDVWRNAKGATLSVFVGEVVPYEDFKKLTPVFGFAVKF